MMERAVYGRQIMLPEIGESGQKKLRTASVLVIGAGGLGSPVAFYLAAAGIGRLVLVDGDVVSLSNLNRQILYGPDDVDRFKAEAAAERLRQQFPLVKTEAVTKMLTAENCDELVCGMDVVVDCLDNFPARLLLNDACLRHHVPLVHGGIAGFSGQIMTVLPGETACLRCLMPEGEERKDDVGVIGAAVGVIGCMQALEACKLLLGLPVAGGTLTLYDGMMQEVYPAPLKPRPDCVCQKNKK